MWLSSLWFSFGLFGLLVFILHCYLVTTYCNQVTTYCNQVTFIMLFVMFNSYISELICHIKRVSNVHHELYLYAHNCIHICCNFFHEFLLSTALCISSNVYWVNGVFIDTLLHISMLVNILCYHVAITMCTCVLTCLAAFLIVEMRNWSLCEYNFWLFV